MTTAKKEYDAIARRYEGLKGHTSNGELEKIYTANLDIIRDAARRLSNGYRGKGLPTLDEEDLMQEAFFALKSFIWRKPAGVDIRDFLRQHIGAEMQKAIRKKAGREKLWGEEVYFDIAHKEEVF
jgi:DNA-directed RNA polymerase specialized sigma24 family protein